MNYYIETHIVDHCNLNCVGCAHFSPLVRKPRFKDLQEFGAEIARLKDVFGDELERFALMGGEPLLHPDIIAFLEMSKQMLGNTQIELVTNGILMAQLGDKFIDKLNELKVKLRFTDYGLSIDKSFLDKLELVHIEDRPKLFNISLNLNGNCNPTCMYYHCPAVFKSWLGYVYSGCFMLRDGKLYQCGVGAYANDFERYFNFKFDESLDNMGISIFTHSKEQIIDFLTHPHEFCKYCNIFKLERTKVDFRCSERKIEEWVDVEFGMPTIRGDNP